jgi:NurA-like 5'-3' nuclease
LSKRKWGGVARLKHHFAGTGKDAPPCQICPENLKETYQKLLKKHFKEEKGVEIVEDREEEDEHGVENKRRSTMDAYVVQMGGGPNAKKKLKQITMNTMVKSRIPACRKIMKCIYDCGLPLSLVKSPLFKDMIE